MAINPGNTSTKIGLFKDKELISSEIIRYDKGELVKFKKIIDQLDFRLKSIDSFIQKNNIDLSEIDFFIGRGGYLRPLKSGLYEINNKMVEDLVEAKYGEHSSNLGAIIAYSYACEYKKKSYILDPVCVDELEPVARISGHPAIERKSIFHALNQKRVAQIAARELGLEYRDINLIVAHLGSGISVALHKRGRVVDVNHAIDGEGPFAPQRSGGLPVGGFLRYIFEHNLNYDESFSMLYGHGGLAAYFGTSDFAELMQKYEKNTNKKVKIIIDAMAYQISKYIASLSAPVCGQIDGIVLTGGLAYSKTFINLIISNIKFLTNNIFVYSGEDELLTMAEGIILGVNKKIEILKYF